MRHSGLVALSTAVLAVSASPAVSSNSKTPVGAAYFLANQPSTNAIVVHDIYSDGTVGFSGAFLTGGRGGYSNPERAPEADALQSQGALVRKGTTLFAVNAGSNTVSMFAINPQQPNQLTMVGKPTNTNGDFPTSITTSPTSNEVCVLNAGKNTGIQCFWATPNGGLQAVNKGSFQFTDLKQTTPPSNGPFNSVSQIAFTPDGKNLLVSYKGVLPSNTSALVPGWIRSYPVAKDGSITQSFTETNPTGGLVAFSMTFIPGKNAVLNTDPATGYFIYDYQQGYNKPANTTAFAIPGQKATCWSEYAQTTKTFFVSDTTTGLITEVAIDSKLNATNVKQYNIGGMVLDEAIVSIKGTEYLYAVLPDGGSVGVMKLKANAKSSIIQTEPVVSNVNAYGVPIQNSIWLQGMAAFIKPGCN